MLLGAAIPTAICSLNGTHSKRRAVWRGNPHRHPPAKQYPLQEACSVVLLSLSTTDF
ncbi:MAG: hypothetical protein LBT00_15525 [Spirochaetaceae bacterium]|nr:hypothetical protein [Spirochaetaceae bacterium]